MNSLASALERIRPETIDAHLRFLSHPLLEGRSPGTRGGELAAEYIRSQFQRIGLHAVGGSYLQPVPLVGMSTTPELALRLPDGSTLEPAYADAFVAWAGVPEAEVAVDAELVYVDYGIFAPEYEWDDYKRTDVRGKVLLVRVNEPGSADTPEFFGGEALTYYGRWTYKFEEASRRGATGAILIHTDESAGYGWNVVRSSNTREHFAPAGTPEHPLLLRGWVTAPAARAALCGAGFDLDALTTTAGERSFTPVSTNIRLRARVRSRIREVNTSNVVGCVRARDPRETGEAVILSSHYDHLGTGVGPDGIPAVYHGAYDNASGVALLLAVAEAAAVLPAPARSLLFMATTAEESGLLGAEWYARHPLVPLARTAAVLNVDGANLQGRTHDLTPLGADRSELGEWVRRAAREEGIEIAPEPHPEQGMFFRQDHFPFARAGVPALALDHGLRFEGRPEGWGEAWYEEFVAHHYHQPSDAYRVGVDYGGAVQQGRVMLRTALLAAEAPEFPEWAPGGEFQRSP